MREKLKSRKLWVTIGSILLGIFYPPAVPLISIVAPTYLGAQGVADAALNLKNKIEDVRKA